MTATVSLVLALAFQSVGPGTADSAAAPAKAYIHIGLKRVDFPVRGGTIRLNFPQDIAAGDSVSGTVFFEPKGSTKADRDRYESELNSCYAEIAGHKIVFSLGEFKYTVPAGVSSVDIVIKDKKGLKLADGVLDVNPQAQDELSGEVLQVPNSVEANQTMTLRGRFDGNFESSSVKVGGSDLAKLAESPRVLVVQWPETTIGPVKVDVAEGTRSCQCTTTGLHVQSTLLDSKVARGKETTLTVQVTGVEGLTAPAQLKILNRNPAVVRLEGGDDQTIELSRQNGPYVITRKVTSATNGSFTIIAYLYSPGGWSRVAMQ